MSNFEKKIISNTNRTLIPNFKSKQNNLSKTKIASNTFARSNSERVNYGKIKYVYKRANQNMIDKEQRIYQYEERTKKNLSQIIKIKNDFESEIIILPGTVKRDENNIKDNYAKIKNKSAKKIISIFNYYSYNKSIEDCKKKYKKKKSFIYI